MALRLTQPLTVMSTRNISWRGKDGRCVGLTIVPPSCAECHEIWEPQLPGNPQGLSRPAMGLLYLTFFCVYSVYVQTHAVDKKWGCLTMVHTSKHVEYRPVNVHQSEKKAMKEILL